MFSNSLKFSSICVSFYGHLPLNCEDERMKSISKLLAISIVAIFVLSAFAGLFGTLLSR
ncbi:hypothetical protein EW15_0101 [Prochlorococcus sp. MIT 0801]|nr:hypothetical protein EW15_0101 [Prochlorococcus sp. MIT 0801]